MIEIDTGETPEQKLERHKAEFIASYGMGEVLGLIGWLEYRGSGDIPMISARAAGLKAI